MNFMEYEINGKTVTSPGECGIYKAAQGGLYMGYAAMDTSLVVSTINFLPKAQAIEAVVGLRNTAAEQVQWKETPKVMGSPILQMIPGPTPIEEVRDNIANTEKFCNDVLEALKGEWDA